MKIRTRFAPSPTGYLHIGSARTALFAWLFAKHNAGKFILRIEDTDLKRSTSESSAAILQAMEWLGLDYDEGPFYQTKRMAKYKEALQQLLEQNSAYYCDCSQERLAKLREEQIAKKLKPKYDNHCRARGLKASENTVIRFCNPLTGKVIFKDEVYGEIIIENSELDDLILERSDGVPTYNLTATIDDADMQISHIIRGDDHLNNTPKQINLRQALGLSIPIFAHLPMILNENGKRLSKRHDAVNVMQYKDEGILPSALLNYLVRMGWSHGDQEIFSIKEMTQLFDLNNVHRAPASINNSKLLWMNKLYLQEFENNNYLKELEEIIIKLGGNLALGPSLETILPIFTKRGSTLVEVAKDCLFLYLTQVTYNRENADKFLINDIKESLSAVGTQLGQLDDWQSDKISLIIKAIVKDNQLKFPQLAQPIRIAITGDIVSPSIDQSLYLLGKARSEKLIQNAVNSIS